MDKVLDINNDSLFRLAAVIYADSNYNVSTETVLGKVIESVFIEKNKFDLTTFEVIEFCNNHYHLQISDIEINSIVVKSEYYKTYKLAEDNLSIVICKLRFEFINSNKYQKSVEKFIDEYVSYIEEEYKAIDIKGLIYRFLYEQINANIKSFASLISFETNIEQINVQLKEYKDEEREVINKFLRWKCAGKDEAIFNIICYSIEYCLINNKSGTQIVSNKGIFNKIILLDTNILYRALGLNGEERKSLTNIFLNKCNSCGIKFKISGITEKEFLSSIKYHINQLEKYPTKNLRPELFIKLDVNESIYRYYHTWRIGRTDTSLKLFLNHIKAIYQKFITDMGIEFDYTIPYSDKSYYANNPKDKEAIKSYFNSLCDHEIDEEGRGQRKSVKHNLYDAYNVHLLEKLRKKGENNFINTKYFMVSSDQGLRRWDYKRYPKLPVILMPSQLYTLILRFDGRTNDDFMSFVSFINLKQASTGIDSRDLLIICSTIDEITSDFNQQQLIIETFIEDNFSALNNIGNDPNRLKKTVKSRAEKVLENVVCEAQSEVAAVTEKLNTSNSERLDEFRKFKEIYHSKISSEIQDKRQILKLLEDKREQCEKKAKRQVGFLFIVPIIIAVIIVIVLVSSGTYFRNYSKIEPFHTLILSAIAFIMFISRLIFGKVPSAIEFRKKILVNRTSYVYKKYHVSINQINKMKEMIDSLESDLDPEV